MATFILRTIAVECVFECASFGQEITEMWYAQEKGGVVPGGYVSNLRAQELNGLNRGPSLRMRHFYMTEATANWTDAGHQALATVTPYLVRMELVRQRQWAPADVSRLCGESMCQRVSVKLRY